MKKQTLKYILCDLLAAILSWTALFTFRKLVLDPPLTTDHWPLTTLLADPNYYLGLLLIPPSWLALYTILGTYRDVLRKARLKELLDTLLATLLGSLAIFFLLLLDDSVSSYRQHYLAFLFLFLVHFLLTYLPRLLITSQTVRRVHSRQLGFPTLLIGSGNRALHTYLDIENQETYSGNQFVGYITISDERGVRSDESHQHSSLLTPHSSLSTIMPCLGTITISPSSSPYQGEVAEGQRGSAKGHIEVASSQYSVASDISDERGVMSDESHQHSSLLTPHSSLSTDHQPLTTILTPLSSLITHHSPKIQEVIIALEEDQKHLINHILRHLITHHSSLNCIKITPDARDLIVGSVRQQSIFHSPFIVINNRLMPEWQYSLKRIADVTLASLAIILLSPLFLLTAIIVRTTSPGPVFYAQERIGLHGRPFRMHKFRSMYVDAEQAGPALSSDNDPRITPFGRFMRKVRLDEIPQFYNVLRGTMSIVGPRPERQYYIDQIVQRAPEYLLLQRIKPGITSWGQVKYGYASSVDQMVERLRYDLLYLDNMSITTDLKIMLYTAKIILQGRGK